MKRLTFALAFVIMSACSVSAQTFTIADVDAAAAAIAQQDSADIRIDRWLTKNTLTPSDHVSNVTQFVTSFADDAITFYGIKRTKGDRDPLIEGNPVRAPFVRSGQATAYAAQLVVDLALWKGGDYIIRHSHAPQPGDAWSWPAAVRGARIGSIASHILASYISARRAF